MAACERLQAPDEVAAEARGIRAGPAQGLCGDGLHGGEGVLHTVIQLRHQQFTRALGPHALGDILQYGRDPGDCALRIAHRVARGEPVPQVLRAARGLTGAGDVQHRTAGLQNSALRGLKRPGEPLGHHFVRCPRDMSFGWQAADRGEARIHVEEAQLPVHQRQADRHVVIHRAQFRDGLAHLGFVEAVGRAGAACVGDVVDCADPFKELSLVGRNGNTRRPHPSPAADLIAGAQAELDADLRSCHQAAAPFGEGRGAIVGVQHLDPAIAAERGGGLARQACPAGRLDPSAGRIGAPQHQGTSLGQRTQPALTLLRCALGCDDGHTEVGQFIGGRAQHRRCGHHGIVVERGRRCQRMLLHRQDRRAQPAQRDAHGQECDKECKRHESGDPRKQPAHRRGGRRRLFPSDNTPVGRRANIADDKAHRIARGSGPGLRNALRCGGQLGPIRQGGRRAAERRDGAAAAIQQHRLAWADRGGEARGVQRDAQHCLRATLAKQRLQQKRGYSGASRARQHVADGRAPGLDRP